MDLETDSSTPAKMVACSELLRRLEHHGLESVLPETYRLLTDSDPDSVTAYIKLENGGPVEYDAIANTPHRQEDIGPWEFDFGVTVDNDDDLTAAAIRGARSRLSGLLTLHEGGV